jgi:hypothetical protein
MRSSRHQQPGTAAGQNGVDKSEISSLKIQVFKILYSLGFRMCSLVMVDEGHDFSKSD